jgi:uncharacterized membrane protein YphA (DoxX/SURF4 family)
VQRLFSMFPTGMAGAALFVLRLSIATTFVVDGTAHCAPVTSFWIFLGFAIPAIFLFLGFLTPYLSVVCGLAALCSLFIGGNSPVHLLGAVADAGVLATLGPGAYSIDARMFGRRLITLSPRK